MNNIFELKFTLMCHRKIKQLIILIDPCHDLRNTLNRDPCE